MRARLLEWSAIAAANAGRRHQEVASRFELAMADNPFDPLIRANWAAYAGSRLVDAVPPRWDLPAQVNLREARRDFEEALRAVG